MAVEDLPFADGRGGEASPGDIYTRVAEEVRRCDAMSRDQDALGCSGAQASRRSKPSAGSDMKSLREHRLELMLLVLLETATRRDDDLAPISGDRLMY